MKKLLYCILLVAAGHKGWTYWQARSVEPLEDRPYLVVYGRDSCGFTQGTLRALSSAGVSFRYLNVDDPVVADSLHGRMKRKGIDTRYYYLPVVDLNNAISIRPDNATLVAQAKAAVP